jgi:acetylornithine deacetylase/succinyl-diaminopimelate desuccinylase-like protein
MPERVKLDGRLILEFVVDEESGADSPYGTQLLLQKGITARVALIGEPGTAKVAIGHRGGYRFRLTTIGEAVHTGTNAWEKKTKGRNAILDMAKVACALQKIELPYKPARAFPGRIPVFTFPTKIAGGRAINMVPDRCKGEGDVRLMPGNSDKQVRMWIEDCLEHKCPEVVYEIADLTFVPSVEIGKHEEIVDLLVKNATEVLGRKPKVLGAGPWNDAWMLINRGIPTICGFGPDGDNVHAADEYVDLKSLQQVTEIYARLIVDYLGIQKK